jgi:hypothetical protein
MNGRGLLVFSRDPGATNVLIATLEALSRDSKPEDTTGLRDLRAATQRFMNNVEIVTRRSAENLWKAAGFEPTIWQGEDDAAAGKLIDEHRAGAILTGTSDIDERGDRALWRAAKNSAIESHVVLDHPAHLRERFIDFDGRITWPNFLYVPDETYVRYLSDIKAPTQSIRILGDLHHYRLRALAGARKLDDIASLRAAWDAEAGTFVVLFASECVREMTSMGGAFSFDEVVEFESLLRLIAQGKRPGGGTLELDRTVVVIRPHPRDMLGKYDGVIAQYRSQVRVMTSDRGSPDLALLAADIVVGMESSLLYEAEILGRPTLSLIGRDIAAGKNAAGADGNGVRNSQGQ